MFAEHFSSLCSRSFSSVYCVSILHRVRRHPACGQKPLRAKKSNFSSLCLRSFPLRYVRGASAPCFEYRLPTGYAGILPAVKSLFAQKKVIPLRYVRGAFLFVMFAELSSSLCSRSFSSVFCVSIFHRVRRHPACGQNPLRAKKSNSSSICSRSFSSVF